MITWLPVGEVRARHFAEISANAAGKADIAATESAVRVLVMHTREDFLIAREVKQLACSEL